MIISMNNKSGVKMQVMFKRKFVTKTGKVIVNYGPLALNRMSCLIDTFSTKFVSPMLHGYSE